METAITTTTSEATTISASRKSALFILNILTPSAHNNPQYRVASELCPGKRVSEWGAGELAKYGYTEMLRIRLAHLMAESGVEGVKKECNWNDADAAAENGHVEVIRELRAHDVHCTSDGADVAAGNGHMEMVQDLRAHGIQCTSQGAKLGAMNGHVEVIRDLRAHDIHSSPVGADLAAENGHMEVIRDLRAH